MNPNDMILVWVDKDELYPDYEVHDQPFAWSPSVKPTPVRRHILDRYRAARDEFLAARDQLRTALQ